MKRLSIFFSIVALLSLSLTGCRNAEAGDTELVSLVQLPCHELDAGVWESAPLPPATPVCNWLKFDDSSTYQIFHDLGRTPRVVLGYIAFEESGSGASLGSGDTFLLRDSDDRSITVRNGTQQDFYLRLVLQ